MPCQRRSSVLRMPKGHTGRAQASAGTQARSLWHQRVPRAGSLGRLWSTSERAARARGHAQAARRHAIARKHARLG
eukprot:8375490-Alexandrium_andersonii.AAC.1